MQHVRALLAVLTLVAGTLVGTGSVGGPGASPAAALVPATYARQAHVATNEQRRRHGRVPLDGDRCLKGFATRQAERMARQRRIFHQELRPILRRCDMRIVGENVAVGYPTGRAVVNRGWMRSPGHRANLLRPAFREVAITARKGGGRWYVAQVLGRR